MASQLKEHEFEETPGDNERGEPGMLQSMDSQRVEHDSVTEQYQQKHQPWIFLSIFPFCILFLSLLFGFLMILLIYHLSQRHSSAVSNLLISSSNTLLFFVFFFTFLHIFLGLSISIFLFIPPICSCMMSIVPLEPLSYQS